MKITLLTVGKTDGGWIKTGFDTYVARLAHYVRFEVKELVPPRFSAGMPVQAQKEKEGEMILKSLKTSDRVVLLDERGEMRSSTEWAGALSSAMVSGRDIVYVIGGPFGFSKGVYDRADAMLSLSRLTFSHQMVRAIFAEGLYRAFTIIHNEKYHHE